MCHELQYDVKLLIIISYKNESKIYIFNIN